MPQKTPPKNLTHHKNDHSKKKSRTPKIRPHWSQNSMTAWKSPQNNPTSIWQQDPISKWCATAPRLKSRAISQGDLFPPLTNILRFIKQNYDHNLEITSKSPDNNLGIRPDDNSAVNTQNNKCTSFQTRFLDS